MRWRRLRPGELDHEALWLGVSLAALALAWGWLHLKLPLPGCAFHYLTGLPCPTCGMTRSLRFALHLDWWSAVRINPLAFATFGAIALFDLYATIVLAFRLPRLRFDNPSVAWRLTVRCAVIAAIVGNWAWLLWIGL